MNRLVFHPEKNFGIRFCTIVFAKVNGTVENEPVLLLFATLVLFPYAKSSISLIFVKKTQFSSLKKRLFIAYITKILGGIFLVCKNLSFGIVKSKIDHFRKVPCKHTVHQYLISKLNNLMGTTAYHECQSFST